MKMPKEELDTILFAPCGMNCAVCYRHCNHKKPCEGCLKSGSGKPEHCRKCEIKDCVEAKGRAYCFQCAQYPCKRIQNLEKSYRRYDASLMENSLFVKEYGLVSFMGEQKKKYTCSVCGGILSLHDGVCSECGTKENYSQRGSDKDI